MNKIAIIGIMALSVTCVLADEASDKAANKAKMEERMMQKVGGKVARPGSQKGEVCVVDCQKRVQKAWTDEVVAKFREITKFNITYKEGTFDFAAPIIQGNATLFIIDDPKMPAILIAPENRWAMVNAATLAKEKRSTFFQARSKKQLARTLACLLGASNSQYPQALTRGIVNEADLDKNFDITLPVDVVQRFAPYMESYGVTPEVVTTYRRACEEGWAPAPTNVHQKVIWEKVKAEANTRPSNPMKIIKEKK